MANVFDEYVGMESSATPPPTTAKGNVFDDYLGTTPITPTPVAPVAPKKSPGFLQGDREALSRVGDIFKNRGNAISQETGGKVFPPSDDAGTGGEKQLRALGQAAQVIPDLGVEGARQIIPPHIKAVFSALGEKLKPLLQTEVGRAGIKALKIGGGAWDLFEQENPNIAKDIKGAFNIVTGSFAGLGGKLLGRGAIQGAKEVGGEIAGVVSPVAKEAISAYKDMKVIGKSTDGVDTAIAKKVEEELPKILKPSNKNLARELTETSDYYKKATPMFEDVVMNKNAVDATGKSIYNFADAKGKPTQLPQTVADHVAALDIGETKTWNEVVKLREAASKEGVVLPPDDIQDMIGGFKKAKAINLASTLPNKVQADAYIDDAIKGLTEYAEKGMPLSVAQRDMAILNDIIYNKGPINPGYIYGIKESDIYMASKLRENMNKVIDDFHGGGPEFEKAKAMYGSYKVTKEDAIKRANQIARTPEYSLFDMPDMYMAYHGGYGLLTGNPATVAATLGAAGAKKYEKMMISPDRQMKKLYESIDTMVDQKRRMTSPQSKFGQTVQKEGQALEAQSMDGYQARSEARVDQTLKDRMSRRMGKPTELSSNIDLEGLTPSDVALRKARLGELQETVPPRMAERQQLQEALLNNERSKIVPAVVNTKPVPTGAPVKSYPNWENVPLESQQPRNYPRLPDTQKQLPAPNPHRTIGDFIKAYESASPQGQADMLKTLSGEDRKWIPFIKSGNYKKARGRI